MGRNEKGITFNLPNNFITKTTPYTTYSYQYFAILKVARKYNNLEYFTKGAILPLSILCSRWFYECLKFKHLRCSQGSLQNIGGFVKYVYSGGEYRCEKVANNVR